MKHTRFTNVEVTGELKAGTPKFTGLNADDYTVTSPDATAAAGEAPTKAEFDAVVTLANEIKADLNALIAAITE